MSLNKTFQRRGVTLVELMIMTSIIGIVFFLSTTMIRFMNNVSREKLAYESQRDVEVWLYLLSRDVRDAQSIVAITSTTLQLQVYDVSKGYDVNTPNNDFFNQAKLQNLNYSLITDATGTYLDRKLQAPGNPATAAVLDEKKVLRNVIERDDPATVDFERVFTPVPEDAISDYNAVQIDFRVHPKGFNIPARVYRAQAMLRRTNDS